MSRYTFTHDKGNIVFTDTETNRQYEMNINSGIFKNAESGREIKGMPVGFGKFLDNYRDDDMVIRVMRYLRENPSRYDVYGYNYVATNTLVFRRACHYLNLVDRAQNLGAKCDRYYEGFSKHYLDLVNTHFKAFSNYCRTTENPTIDSFVKNYERQLFFDSIGVDKYHFTEEEKNYLFDGRDEAFFQPKGKNLSVALYYLSRGLFAFCGRDALRKIREYFRLCEALEIEPQKEDFYRAFINAKRTYTMRKAEIDAATLVRNYNKKRNALAFENDDFIVIIPQTAEEFKAEADAQCNCVFSSYLQAVMDERTYVVFIRRKDNPAASLITCEVRLDGTIWQYLARFNARPTDAALIDFENQYQAHLREVWDN